VVRQPTMECLEDHTSGWACADNASCSGRPRQLPGQPVSLLGAPSWKRILPYDVAHNRGPSFGAGVVLHDR